MKKTLCILLAIISVFSFSSCQKKREYTEDNYNVSPNLEITTEKSAYPSNVKKINYSIKNHSDTEEVGGFYIYLSKLIDGEWKIVSFDKEVDVEWLAFIVPAKGEFDDAFIVDKYFDYPLEPGEYRLVKPNEARSNSFIIE